MECKMFYTAKYFVRPSICGVFFTKLSFCRLLVLPAAMANTNAGGDHVTKNLWLSHNKMVMEALDTNDPEVGRLSVRPLLLRLVTSIGREMY